MVFGQQTVSGHSSLPPSIPSFLFEVLGIEPSASHLEGPCLCSEVFSRRHLLENLLGAQLHPVTAAVGWELGRGGLEGIVTAAICLERFSPPFLCSE